MRRLTTTWLPLLSLLLPATVSAQSNDEISTGIQFNFSTPGARSLAMGGAFLGLADDATTAFTNPAGLALGKFEEDELSAEAKHFVYKTLYTASGHAPSSFVSNIGADTVSGVQNGSRTNSTNGLSYFSYVIPKGPWTLALYRHELANFEASIQSPGPFFGATLHSLNRVFADQSSMELDIAAYGFSAARKISSDLSLGASLAYYVFDLDSSTSRYFYQRVMQPISDPSNTSLGGFFGPPDFSAGNVVTAQTQQGHHHDFGLNAGFLWKPQRSPFSVGGIFRQGPTFSYDAVVTNGPRSGGVTGQVVTMSNGVSVGGQGRFHVPDTYGIGAGYFHSFQDGNELRMDVDYQRVRYSQLLDHFVNMIVNTINSEQLSRFTISDANEVHIGAEYKLYAFRSVFYLRAGAWADPDHRLRFESSDPADLFLSIRFRRGENLIHSTGGVGFSFGANYKYKVSAALDYSRNAAITSLSFVTRIPDRVWRAHS